MKFQMNQHFLKTFLVKLISLECDLLRAPLSLEVNFHPEIVSHMMARGFHLLQVIGIDAPISSPQLENEGKKGNFLMGEGTK